MLSWAKSTGEHAAQSAEKVLAFEEMPGTVSGLSFSSNSLNGLASNRLKV
jgi:hypothetical protein